MPFKIILENLLVDNDYNGNFTPTVPDFDFDDNDDISHLFQGKSVPLPQARPQVQQVQVHRAALAGLN